MRTALASLALVVALGAAAPAVAEDRTTTLRVRNMTCALCPIIVRRAIETIPGVKEITVSTETGTATVVYNDRATNPTELAETVARAGYPSWPLRK
jgi:periplasmic mercuric ion binding protein